jgi:hypothetical protein
MKNMRKSKFFNGRIYVLLKNVSTKTEATSTASRLRREKYNIRIIKVSKGYDIYYR